MSASFLRPLSVLAPADIAALAALAASSALATAFLLGGCAGHGRPEGGDRGYDYSLPHREHDFDRAGFGESSLPIWSALTPPERRALEGRERAAAGDPAALLDLAILASGGPRSAEAYDSIHHRVEAFVARKRPRYAAEPSEYMRAMLLHQAMHKEFFLQGPAYLAREGVGPGYDFEQSAFAPIFSGGRVNCVSSAILYVILARRFGFKARGVLLPTHAFAEIELSDGKVIEVETTHPGGFGARHDRAFYSGRGPGWFRSRGLAPSTYEDYLARRIVEPLDLIAFNMNNQHAAPARMRQADICRLKEAQAYLSPGDRDAQYNRLAIYDAETRWLRSRAGNLDAIASMYAKVEPELAEAARRWKDDPEMRLRFAWARFAHAHALQELGRDSAAAALLDSTLGLLPGEGQEGKSLRGNCVALLLRMGVAAAEQGRHGEAERLLLRYPSLVRGEAEYRSGLAWVYGNWAARLWEREDWPRALEKLERQHGLSDEEARGKVSGNIAAAYLNWAAALQERGEMRAVRDVLSRCAKRVRGDRRCRDLLDRLAARDRRE